MGDRNSLQIAGAVAIGVGIGLLLAVAGFWLYGQLEPWVEAQSREAEMAAMLRLEMPALTPARSPLPARPSAQAPSPSPVSRRTPTVAATTAPALQSVASPLQPVAPALLSIPKLKIKRAIVPLGMVQKDGKAEWDTDRLFATSSRPDLVGHLDGTGSPGRAGNIVLAGHNYNRGRYNWLGVFVNLKRLSEGDVIYVDSRENERFTYEVIQVEKVNWPPRTTDDMAKHIAHLTATADETLTLVTCGGASLAPFPARVYVTAKRVGAPPATGAPATGAPATGAPATVTPTVTASATATLVKPKATATVTARPTARVEPRPGQSCRATVTVRRGETLATIARQYGVSVRSIARRNGITNPDQIYAGWRLCIP
jgi:LPXTG-site transpeptidase (sortase) family protein